MKKYVDRLPDKVTHRGALIIKNRFVIVVNVNPVNVTILSRKID